jgi:hypothetical protein
MEDDATYDWGLEEDEFAVKSEKTKCNLIIGTFRMEIEICRGSDDYLDEWFSQAMATQTLSPLCHCQVGKEPRTKRVVIKYDPRIQTRKTYSPVFHLGNVLEVTDGNLHSLSYPYDKNAIMRLGNSLDDRIPEDEAQAEFPDEPWPEQFDIMV